MIDIRTLLQPLSIPIAEESFYTAPLVPFLLFMESRTVRGTDNLNKITDRAITLELYTNKISPTVEKSIDDLLNAIPVEFSRDRLWIASEKMYETIYSFSFTEKL